MMIMSAWFGRIPMEQIFVEDNFTVYQRLFYAPTAILWTILLITTDHEFRGDFPYYGPRLLDFLHYGNGSLLSILLVPLLGASFNSEQKDWWLDFLFSTSQRFRRKVTFDGTLVFNDCMEWVQYSTMGWLSPGLVRSKDSLFFT